MTVQELKEAGERLAQLAEVVASHVAEIERPKSKDELFAQVHALLDLLAHA